MTEDVQGCIPDELPDEEGIEFEILLTEIFEGLMGEYETETNEEVVFQCNPQGSWVLPDDMTGTFCDTHFSVPVTIVFPDVEEEYAGGIHIGFTTYHPDPIWHYGARLFYSDENDSWEFSVESNEGMNIPDDDDDNDDDDTSEEEIVWKSTYPDESKRWVKK